MEMEAQEAISKNKSSSDCEIEEVFAAFHDKGKIQCNACNNARKEIVKCKPKSTFTPKLNKLEGLQDVYNFKSTHCQSDSHLYALSVWGGKPRDPMGAVTEHVRRLKENSDTANHDGEGKDESYHHAGTGIYKDLSIKNCFADQRVLGVQTQGTAAYLEMVYKYVDIFYSKALTLLQRCRNASYVVNFLRLWRLLVLNDK